MASGLHKVILINNIRNINKNNNSINTIELLFILQFNYIYILISIVVGVLLFFISLLIGKLMVYVLLSLVILLLVFVFVILRNIYMINNSNNNSMNNSVSDYVSGNLSNGVNNKVTEDKEIKYDTVTPSDNFSINTDILVRTTVLSPADANSTFISNTPLRLNLYYHNLSNIIISSHIHITESVCVGTCKLVYKKFISNNCIYTGCLLNIYNATPSFYIGDLISNNNINFSIISGMAENEVRLVYIPHTIAYNKFNKLGISLNDFILVPIISSTIVVYNNINNMSFIHSTASIIYYGYSLNNMFNRNTHKNMDVNRIIRKKYMKDLVILNNSSNNNSEFNNDNI